MTGEFSIALQALRCVNEEDNLISSDRLSLNLGVNPARVRKVMSRLKQAGLVGAKEGASGGYYMIKDSKSITLDMIIDALGVELIMPRAKSGEGVREVEAMVSMIYDQLNLSCRERLKQFTIESVEQYTKAIEESKEITA